MNELKKIAYNCKQATFLIEKKQITSLTLRERLELKIHLAGCSVCRIFEDQSVVINRMVRELFYSTNSNEEVHLDDEFKSQLHKQIEEKLNNS